MLESIARELEQTLREITPKLNSISESASQAKIAPDKWSRKEILGHMIDSASNNHQRFIRAQISDEIRLPGYEQERWVQTQGYQHESWTDLVNLWQSYNKHLAHLIATVPEEKLKNHCLIGDDEPVTLDFLMKDYLRHLKHHLTQVFGGR